MTTAASPFGWARLLARRLLSIGINPYQSDMERYVVLLGQGAGEIVDWGPPLRGSRFFGPNAIRKDRPMVEQFSTFAREDGLRDCVFWCIGLPGAKAKPDSLEAELKRFNKIINLEFSELRKTGNFEVLLLAIHPRYDGTSGLFDLHAHFVARVPQEHREEAKRRILLKFSKIDLSEKPIRKPAAVATYMLWGIFRNRVMIKWPDHALEAAWQLTQRRFHFVRAGGSFAEWRASQRPTTSKAVSVVDEEKRRSNRADTADPRQMVVNGDRLLSKIMVKIRGVHMPALLYEAMSPASEEGQPRREYSSTSNIITQEAVKGIDATGEERGRVQRRWFQRRAIPLIRRVNTALLCSAERLKEGFRTIVIRILRN